MNSLERKIKDKVIKKWDKLFDAGWKEFCKDIQGENDVSNERMFKLLFAIKGEEFIYNLRELMMFTDCEHSRLHISHKPKGVEIPENRLSSIKTIWIDQRSTRAYENATYEGYIYVQVKKDRWVKFHYFK